MKFNNVLTIFCSDRTGYDVLTTCGMWIVCYARLDQELSIHAISVITILVISVKNYNFTVDWVSEITYYGRLFIHLIVWQSICQII